MEGSASQAGFYYQNNIAALKIIECLFFDSDIVQIRLENYEKGNHIDDIIICRRERTDYFQVKWSEDKDNAYSLYNLLKSEEKSDGKSSKKSLFRQLAEGYESVKASSTNLSITLYTTKKESSQKRPSAGIKHSLPEIKKNIFEPLKQATESYKKLPNYLTYKDTLEKIREESGLDSEGFNDFIKKLEFAFSQEPIENVQQALKFKLETLGIETGLMEKLLNGVVKWSISGESITKDLVLEELGITGRFEDKLSHYFKVIEEGYYVPNQLFFDSLQSALTLLKGGYIFIEGLPGIGKSTALTKFKEQHDDIALAYYCFIPDTRNNFGELRHQSYYFLKSLCIAIEKNFPELDLPSKYSEKYSEKLHAYIEALSRIKRKVIFIIDGLDHVHRDTTIGEKSLLHHIKGDLPENVFFILSSQYDAVLSPFVKNQINSDSKRKIRVLPFTQPEIKIYLQNKDIESTDFLDRIERISGGIPVYLHYISELLVKTDPKDYEDVLNNFPELAEGSINSYHEYLFQKIEDDTFSKWVLAVLAYRRETTTPETIQQILKIIGEDRGIIAITDVINKFSHLLRHLDGRAYTIFHNSFREFIISKTTALKDIFNQALVSFYEQNPFTDEAYRNYFTHLFELKEHAKILYISTLDWIKDSWRNFRPMEEIQKNLAIAIESAIEQASLSKFIRLAFLKSQLDRANWTLENSDIDFPTLLLNAGKTANSLRGVWDGDFVLTSKEYFCYYLEQYYSKTKTLLPQNIIKQGLSKSLKESNVAGLTKEFRAESLITDDIVGLFNEIDLIKWHSSDDRQTSYEKKRYTSKENKQTNLGIKLKVVDCLTGHKQYLKLLQLTKSVKKDLKILPKVQMALITLLLPVPSEKVSAVKIIKEIDFSKISEKSFVQLICFSSDFLSDIEIRELFPARTLSEPVLHEDVVDKETMNYALHKEILNFYKNLKPIWIFQTELIKTLNLKITHLSSLSREIYQSLFSLSDLWHQSRSQQMSESDILNQLNQSIQSLYIKRKSEFKTRASGLFDMDTNTTFIRSSIKHLYKDIFNLATELLSEKNLDRLVDFWISLDKSGDGYKHYTTGLTIADKIRESQYSGSSNLLYKIIIHAEETVREEQDTGTLTSYLGEIAESYGVCGFEEDFERIYGQLIDISFGVGHRKDYQSVDIIEPMEMMHKIDPKRTLERLTEVFHIQDMINEAGNGRMRHICLSYLIKFTFSKHPELAFQLMELEEPAIARAEALEIIIDPSISNCTSDELPFYLAIIKTLPRWESRASDESYFTKLAKNIVSRAIALKNDQVLKEAIDVVKFNALVELEDEKLLIEFSELMQESGLDHNDYLPSASLKQSEQADKSIASEKTNREAEKFSIAPKKLEFSEVAQLFSENYEAFEQYLQTTTDHYIQNSRNQFLRTEYHTIKSVFEGFYKSTPLENQKFIASACNTLIKEFVALKTSIVKADPQIPFRPADFKNLVLSSIEKINYLLPEKTFTAFAEEKFNIEGWFKSIEREFNWSGKHYFSLLLSDEQILQLVREGSIEDMDKIQAFVEKWTTDKVRAISLLMIANRLVPFELEKAKKIIYLAGTQFQFDSALFQKDDDPNKLEFDILKTLLEADPEFGKRLVLNSYYTQNGKYRGELTSYINRLLKYAGYFGNEAVIAYYESNLINNKELASGLPVKVNKYEFITAHIERLSFAEVTVKHIVWLFNYPAVKIRELALQSVFDLIHTNPEVIKHFIRFGIDQGIDNEIEYCLVVLQAIALKDPKQLVPYKTEFQRLLKKEHFNIVETAKELLLLIHKADASFLAMQEVKDLQFLNSHSPIILADEDIRNLQKPGRYIFTQFQYDLIFKLNQNEKHNSIFHSIYADMVAKGLGHYNQEQEGNVHQRYNINTNYDTIEICSPYYDHLKSSINKVFYLNIKRNRFDSAFIDEVQKDFRVYDPSKLLYPIVTRPDYVNWIPDNITPEQFLSFSDFDTLVKDFIGREEEYITLVECGCQRKNTSKEFSGTCYFEVKAYLKTKDFETDDYEFLPFSIKENEYAYELPLDGHYSADFPTKHLKPLVQMSYNSFRGEDDAAIANLLGDIFMAIGFEKKNLLEIFTAKPDYPVKATRWINSYTSGAGWRRYKPSSDGFTVEIKKDILSNLLQKSGLELSYNIILRRSTDTYRTENIMRWRELDKNFIARF